MITLFSVVVLFLGVVVYYIVCGVLVQFVYEFVKSGYLIWKWRGDSLMACANWQMFMTESWFGTTPSRIWISIYKLIGGGRNGND